MNYLELLVDFHLNNYRQGPGSKEATLKALSFIPKNDKEKIKIADIGCGSGQQTIDLAKNTNSQIAAVDLFPRFLDKLNYISKELGLSNRIKTVCESMENLSFKKESLDMIWSEGAIYNMGFKNGLQQWRKFLKKGGFMAVSEICWIRPNRPKKLCDFWNKAYSGMDSFSNKIKVVEECGFAPLGAFVLPQECWVNNYYEPSLKQIPDFLQRHNNSDEAKATVKEHMEEMEMYVKYRDYYSYGFFIGTKI
ncbi:class I SAM-dependent methyltransferase [Saccharicrinis sp. GN24d3]|uniref:class I SAM-dependent methyltransferase n=1 Tax=Saccharicrinis sp. GN24d3 TaxID=3458416 RepID=UPI004037149D